MDRGLDSIDDHALEIDSMYMFYYVIYSQARTEDKEEFRLKLESQLPSGSQVYGSKVQLSGNRFD
jgi:hypothetical protein